MHDDRYDILAAAFPGESGRFPLSLFSGGSPESADGGALNRERIAVVGWPEPGSETP